MDRVQTDQKFPSRRRQDKGFGPAINGIRLPGDIAAIDPPTPAFVTGDVPNIGDNDGHLIDSQWSQELRLSSGAGSALDWILGAFLYHEDNRIDPIRIRNWLAGPGGAGTQVTFNARQKTDSWAPAGAMGGCICPSMSNGTGRGSAIPMAGRWISASTA